MRTGFGGGGCGRVVVVDNGSTDGPVELARRHRPSPEVIEVGRNLGFATALNRAVAGADPAADVLALNANVRLEPQARRRLQARLGAPGGGGRRTESEELQRNYHDAVKRYASMTLGEYGVERLWSAVEMIDSRKLVEDEALWSLVMPCY